MYVGSSPCQSHSHVVGLLPCNDDDRFRVQSCESLAAMVSTEKYVCKISRDGVQSQLLFYLYFCFLFISKANLTTSATPSSALLLDKMAVQPLMDLILNINSNLQVMQCSTQSTRTSTVFKSKDRWFSLQLMCHLLSHKTIVRRGLSTWFFL